MKKFLFLVVICLIASAPALAVYPENEADFLYGRKDNSTIKHDYNNQHSYIKTSNNMYVREDGATIYKTPSGIIQNSNGKSYMPVGSGSSKMYVPMDL